jgi:hypothetical protein
VPFVYRAAAPADRPALLRLFSAAFGETADRAVWAWKYDEGPHRAPSAVALDAGRIVGFYGGWATRYRGAGGDVPGAAAVDVMTDPAARALGGGLFAGLAAAFSDLCREAGMPFYFGFPHERHRHVGERKAGYASVEAAGQWSRPLDRRKLVGPVRRRLLRACVGDRLSAGHDALAEALHARPGWRTDRSRVTLAWRFAPHAGVSYRLVEVLDRRDASRGYAAVRIVGERALLVDFQVRDEESGDVGDLLEAVRAGLQGEAVRLELRAPSRSRLGARLADEFGFLPEASDCHFEIRPLDPAFDALAAGRVFDYRFSDHEIF